MGSTYTSRFKSGNLEKLWFGSRADSASTLTRVRAEDHIHERQWMVRSRLEAHIAVVTRYNLWIARTVRERPDCIILAAALITTLKSINEDILLRSHPLQRPQNGGHSAAGRCFRCSSTSDHGANPSEASRHLSTSFFFDSTAENKDFESSFFVES